MAVRTTSDLVKETLQDDYGPKADGSLPSLSTAIATANAVTDRVVTCATGKGIALTASEEELVERWLAAHFYGQSDKPLASKSTLHASGSFHGQTGMRLESTLYGQTAMIVDPSGCLSAMNKRNSASMAWLGKAEPDQLTYEQRN